MDARIPIIGAIAAVVVAAFLILRKRELSRLHKQSGYDAYNPILNQQATANTKAKFRTFSEKSRRYLSIVRAILLAPSCAVIAGLFFWAGWPNQWTMLGIAALFGIGATLLTRNLIADLRQKDLHQKDLRQK